MSEEAKVVTIRADTLRLTASDRETHVDIVNSSPPYLSEALREEIRAIVREEVEVLAKEFEKALQRALRV